VRAVARTNLPAAFLGGLILAVAIAVLQGRVAVSIDTSLRTPLQMFFFAAIGYQATLSALRAGGPRVAWFWAIATGNAVIQNVAGMAVAFAIGVPLAVGIVCGSLTLAGGPATGLAFADHFRELGVPAAGELIIASATFGILMSGLIGNPIATALIRCFDLARRTRDDERPEPVVARSPSPRPRALDIASATAVLLAVTVAGAALSSFVATSGIRFPAVMGPLLVGTLVRAAADRWTRFAVSVAAIEFGGSVALAFFLAIAVGGLKLWTLASVAGPLLAILGVEVVVTAIYCVATALLLMGRTYEGAVVATGHIGFGLGITANALANMQTITERHGPAPHAFVIVPVVGAFFVDLSNAVLLTLVTAILAR
jgi:ESS family glutamate:Na+ symporter